MTVLWIPDQASALTMHESSTANYKSDWSRKVPMQMCTHSNPRTDIVIL